MALASSRPVVQEVAHRGYVIRYRQSGAAGQASVLLGNSMLHRVDAATATEAMDAAKSFVDVRLAERHALRRMVGENSPHPFRIGTAEEYGDFFQAHDLPEYQGAMLRAHAQAPDRILTAGELGRAAGWKGENPYEPANRWYGELGKQASAFLGLNLPKRQNGTTIETCALAYDAPAGSWTSDNDHFRWQMHAEVAEALLSLNMA